MPTYRLRLFAILREKIGSPTLELDLHEPATIADLKHALAQRYPTLRPLLPSLMFAANTEYAVDADLVTTETELAVIPPVSGGQSSH